MVNKISADAQLVLLELYKIYIYRYSDNKIMGKLFGWDDYRLKLAIYYLRDKCLISVDELMGLKFYLNNITAKGIDAVEKKIKVHTL